MNSNSTRPTIGSRIADLLLRYHRAWLVLAGLLTLAAIVPARRLTFDRSIEALYAPSNSHLKDYLESKALFGGDEIVFVAYTDPKLFEDAGQDRLKELTARLTAIEGVDINGSQSLTSVLSATRFAALKKQRRGLLEFSRGFILGEDNQTTAVALRLVDERTAPVSREQTLAEIRRVAAEQPLPTYVVGEPVLVHDMFYYAETDSEWMSWAAAVLLSLVILVFIRNLRAMVLPFVIVVATIFWTRAVLYLSHMQLSMVSSVLNSLLIIVGISTVIYISLFYQRVRPTMSREEAVGSLFRVIGGDVCWVCLTTAAGFGAQLSSHIHPVQSFGITMMIGSLLVLVAIAFILPGGMLVGKEKKLPARPLGDEQMNRSLQGLAVWVLDHPWKLTWGCLLVLGISCWGLLRLELETDFSKNFRASTPVVQALNFVESKLGGAGVWEVNFHAPAELDEDFLERVRALADKLRAIKSGESAGLTKVMAITDGLDLVPRIPILVPGLQGQLRMLERIQADFVPTLYNAEAGRMRIVLRAREQQPSETKKALMARVAELATAEFPEAKVSGLYVLLTYLIENLMEDQWTDLMWGAIGLIGVMTVAYRSLFLGVVSLIPNVVPILIVLGGMGWCGILINIGTAMISSDAMGLTIHDSIFYISAFLRARRGGVDFRGALQEVQTEVRRPLVYSNVALVLGFLVLTTSRFIPVIYFGALVSIAIAGGLAVNLLLLPLLLELREKAQARFAGWLPGKPSSSSVPGGTRAPE